MIETFGDFADQGGQRAKVCKCCAKPGKLFEKCRYNDNSVSSAERYIVPLSLVYLSLYYFIRVSRKTQRGQAILIDLQLYFKKNSDYNDINQIYAVK